MKCIVEDCDQEARSRNMCNKHYLKWLRYGDPTSYARASLGEPLRFLHEDVLTYKGDECLPWPYACNTKGYGQIAINSVTYYVHVVVCEKVNGPRPSPNHVASHKCGQGHIGCCNPNHLKWQTWAEDRADMITHGTNNAKLTDETVLEIRSLEGKMSPRDIAHQFGISRENVTAIMKRRSWAWLK